MGLFGKSKKASKTFEKNASEINWGRINTEMGKAMVEKSKKRSKSF
jgi:predicted DNA-binding WGR domain protein